MSLTVEQWLLYGDGSPNSRELNEEQRKAVTRSGNTVTAAGAGSGKTFVLSRRFAYLVCVRGYKVSQILTLTFTRKATNEMYERIYKTLQEIAQRFNDKNAIQAMQEFYTAKIQTLDSYCSYIIRMKVHYYGITPDFSIDAESAESIAQEMALPFLLSHKENEALKDFAKTTKLDVLAKELFVDTILKYSTISEPIQFKELLENQYEYAKEQWIKEVNKFNICVDSLANEYKSYNPKTKGVFYNRMGELLQISSPEANEIKAFYFYAKNFGDVSLTGQKSAYNPCMEYVYELKRIFETISSVAVFLDKYPVLQELISLLDDFQKEYNKRKCQNGILTFADAAKLALRILLECPDIRQAEKESYKAIMIDEFQDDNILQKEMLYCLAERLDRLEVGKVPASELDKDKLFFVGDEKQSIYRFRDADVSVFRSLADELNDCSVNDSQSESLLNLSCNFRSQPDLIDSFNKIFGGIGKSFDESLPAIFRCESDYETKQVPAYEATYNEVIAGLKMKEGRSSDSHVRFCLFDTEKDKDDKYRLSAKECEADYVAKSIHKMIEEKQYEPKDIVILLRKKTNQHQFEKYLRKYGIPYASESISGLFTDAPANDIFNFLWLCSYPTDKVTYSAVLRSPFISLSYDGLQKILLNKDKEPFKKENADLLCGKEKERYLYGCEVYQKLSSMVGKCAITDAVSTLWYLMGYRYETLWNFSVRQYSEIYDIIFEIAKKADNSGKSMTWFLDSLRGIADNEKKMDDINIPLERGNAVSIMTIHASKGLEFPVVFLCEIDSKGIVNDNDKPIYFSKKWGPSFNLPSFVKEKAGKTKANFFYKLAKQSENQESEAELRRVLYVAMTRAESELYLTGCCKFPIELKEHSSDSKIDTFIDLLNPLLVRYILQNDDGSILSTEDSPFALELIPSVFREKVQVTSETEEADKNNLQNKIQFAQKNAEIYRTVKVVSKPELDSIYRKPSDFELKQIPSDCDVNKGKYSEVIDGILKNLSFEDFGSVSHIYLESWLKQTKPVLPAKFLQNLGKKARQDLDEVCSNFVKEFEQSDIGKQVLQSKWKRAEYVFKYKVGKYILNGIIDLIFLREDGGYTIVDYKTDSILFPKKHYVQQAAYRKAASAILQCPEENISSYLYYFRSGTLVDITEECAKLSLEEIVVSNS